MSTTNSNFDCAICGLIEKEIQFYGFSYCNHPICGVCAIKLQKFSKDVGNDYDYSKCAICKQDISKIIISSKIKLFEEYDENTLLSEAKYGLLFESMNAKRFYDSIIKISCPNCKVTFETMDTLMKHMDKDHQRRYCELCIEFNKCLQYELDAFSNNDYHYHRNEKHPKCKFCEIRFYDESHLIKHVKDKHFVCDICHRNRGFIAYNTQSELLKHYAKDHFVCEICRSQNNINVFESEYNLKTHKVSAHSLSLVGEGLVNVKYGDRDNMRYGARRRAREDHDDFFEDIATREVAQILPIINCEEEFPRLGTEVVNQQLGIQSLNMDENDARTAFHLVGNNASSNESNIPDNTINKSSTTAQLLANQQPDHTMSNNFAISVKRSAGNLNSADFPSLSSTSALSLNNVVKNSVKTTNQQFNNKAKPSLHNNNQPIIINRQPPKQTEEEFPTLSSGNIGTGKNDNRPMKTGLMQQPMKLDDQSRRPMNNGQLWKKMMTKPSNKSVINNNSSSSNNNKMQSNPSSMTSSKVVVGSNNSILSDETSDRIDYDTIIKDPVENKAKVSLISKEEYDQMLALNQTTKQNHNNYPINMNNQSLPIDSDFPSLDGLGIGKNNYYDNTYNNGQTIAMGVWNKSNTTNTNTNTTTINKKCNPIPETFTLDNKHEFPGLPFKQAMKQSSTMSSNNMNDGRHKSKTQKKNNFASAASQSLMESQCGHVGIMSMVTPSMIVGMATDNNNNNNNGNNHHNNNNKVTHHNNTSSSSIEYNNTHHSLYKQPASLKGIDYIPSDAPNKDQITIVDSKHFSIIKSAKENPMGNCNDKTSFSILSDKDFPTSLMTNNDDEHNRFNTLYNCDTDLLKSSKIITNKNTNKKLAAPIMSSESEFPTLGGPQKTKVTHVNKQVDKKTSQTKPTVTSIVKTTPIISLMDVAMSVSNKSYTPFNDADQRNQDMVMLVYDKLDNELAMQFLQLSNLYRIRQLSVHDYLDALQSPPFINEHDFMASLLPQMCIMLPDIPLQRSLMTAMPKTWIRDLRECLKCDQVLHKTDVDAHNQLAH